MTATTDLIVPEEPLLLVEDSWFEESFDGLRGNRVYLARKGTHETDTPQIGDLWPGKNTLRAVSKRYTGRGPSNADGTWDVYFVHIRYDSLTERRLRMWFEATSKVETVAGTGTYKSDGAAVSVAIPIARTQAVIVKEAFHTRSLDKLITEKMNHVNRSKFLGWPAGTLLYVGANYETEEYDSRGRRGIRMTHRWVYDPKGWNKFRRGTSYDTVLVNGSPIYSETNFQALLSDFGDVVI